ncbi:hypothetical protein LTR94_024338 [Friedmanniomyces endolithicus]|nr:hypothetical protein LTR94_024338 [Friedmanniomyces endolithicus]
MTRSPKSTDDRLHGLDALRAGALLLGVLLHASMSFFPQQVWIVADDQRSVWASGLFFVIHLFRMATFFLLAGLFAELLLQRRGVWGFARDRAIRIAAPFLAFWPLVMAAIVVVLIWIGMRMNISAADAPPPPTYTAANIPLTHLWFLWVLLIFYVGRLIVLGGSRLAGRLEPVARFARGLSRRIVAPWIVSPLGVVALGAPLALSLNLYLNWTAFFGAPTPDAGLAPNAPALIAFGLAFVAGALLERRRDLLKALAGWWPVHLGLALVSGFVAMMAAGGPDPVLTPLVQPGLKAVAACAFGLGVYASAFALVGLSLTFLSSYSPVRRYVADASYWVYIIHLPLVMAGQVYVQHFAWPWPVKLVLISVSVVAIALASYELLIRHSFMGRWLNGRRIPWRKAASGALAPAE